LSYFLERRNKQFPVSDAPEYFSWEVLQWSDAVSCLSLDSGWLWNRGKSIFNYISFHLYVQI